MYFSEACVVIVVEKVPFSQLKHEVILQLEVIMASPLQELSIASGESS
jgi:hypothetical protein